MKKCLLFGLLANLCFAGGYEFGGLGARPIGMGGAFIGLADDWSAIYWNPAGLCSLSERGAGSYLEYASIKGKDGNSVKNALPELFAYSWEKASFNKKDIKTSALLPSFGFWQKLSGWTLGEGLYIPNGNAIDWEDTINDGTGTAKAEYHTMLFVSVGNLSLAKEINDNLSIGCGLNLLYGKLELEAKKDYSAPPPFDYSLSSKMEGDGCGLEGVIGFLLKASDKISIGGVLRSGSILELKGEGEGSFQSAILPGTGSEKSKYTQRFSYPLTCGLGIAYRLTPKITITSDWARTGWNSMEEDVDFELDTGSGTSKLLMDRDKSLNWSNTDRFRVGIEYNLNNNWTLRTGFYSDPSPVPKDGVDITKIIDVNVRFITLGASYKRNDFGIDFCYANASGKETLEGIEYEEKGTAIGISGSYKF
ncbi:MAG: outer membrane protein transport protein [bacterium]